MKLSSTRVWRTYTGGKLLEQWLGSEQGAALRLFQSRYGKTEAWYILEYRKVDGEPPYVLLGFKEGVTREKWTQLFERQDIDGMVDALHRIHVEPGQVFLIEGGTPHAIGPGCLLVEIQEPTDLTLRVEKTTPSGKTIPDLLCHLGLGYEKMLDCFHYRPFSYIEVLEKYRLNPVTLQQDKSANEKLLIDYTDTSCFKMTVIEVMDSFAQADHKEG